MSGIFFAHPHTLLDRVGEILSKVGPQKFFSSPDDEVKKAREGFAAYFFTLTLKKFTGRDWWLAQFGQSERQYPDFDFISFSEGPDEIRVESVELTGVYPHFENFEKMLAVVESKQKQYGNKALKFSLLIFVNHEKSEEWIQILRSHLTTPHPFLSIWTIHLRFKKGGMEVGKAVAQRIQPSPGLRVEANTDDQEIHKRQQLPSFLEERKEGNSAYIAFKPEFITKFRKKVRALSRAP
ncbi:MAG: hypothetical protein HY473_01135, partial [Candidatus Sungbacteria bacterium]|nr:hypothetical protein [Candidatus Sungbacteria bacterium]